VIFQAAFANVDPRAVTKVDVHKDDRPPLLVMGNDEDHTIPASVSRAAAKRLGRSKAIVDYQGSRGAPTSRPAHPVGRRWPTRRSTGRPATPARMPWLSSPAVIARP